MKRFYLLSIFLLIHTAGICQEALFGKIDDKKPRHGFQINGTASGDLPMADMAKRYGASYRLGGGLSYKTEKNWLFGITFEFILGNKVKEDSFMINIRDKYSGAFNGRSVEFINVNGERTNIQVYERGYMTGLSCGRIFNFDKSNPDNGLLVVTTAGFMQHKINIFNREGDVPQVRGDYKKGYDRLANGLFIQQYVGYAFYSKNRLFNFNLGLDFVWGFTQGRRDFLYDVQRPDDAKRNDLLIGLKGTWVIPLFKSKVEEITFE